MLGIAMLTMVTSMTSIRLAVSRTVSARHRRGSRPSARSGGPVAGSSGGSGAVEVMTISPRGATSRRSAVLLAQFAFQHLVLRIAGQLGQDDDPARELPGLE